MDSVDSKTNKQSYTLFKGLEINLETMSLQGTKYKQPD